METMIASALLLSLFSAPSIAASASLYRIVHAPQYIRSNREVANFFAASERFESSQSIFRETLMTSLSMSMDYMSTSSSPSASVILGLEGEATEVVTDYPKNFTDSASITSPNDNSSLLRSKSDNNNIEDSNAANANGRDEDWRRTAMGAMVGFGVATIAVLLGVWRNRAHRTRFRRTHFYADPLFVANSKQNTVHDDGINIMMTDREYIVGIV